MANERLRSAIASAEQTYESLARYVGVDPKTVERWIATERVPHRTHRWKTAKLLGHDEAFLWSSVIDDVGTRNASQAEFVELFPTRSSVPSSLWGQLLESARDSLDFMAFAGLFLPDTNSDLPAQLIERGGAGVRVRILLGDPESAAVALRGEEEGIGAGMAERCRMALNYVAPALGAPGVEVRLHGAALYHTLFRSDASLLVNTHVYGSPAAANPVLHLHRIAGGRMVDTYQRAFERVWDGAEPITEVPARR